MYYLYAAYNGKWVNILPKCNNLSWTSSEDTLAVELNFDSLYDLTEGMHLSLMNDNKFIWRGLIIKKSNKQKTSGFISMDYAYYLNENDVDVIQFNGIQANKAIEQVCSKFGIECDVIPIITKIDKLYKAQPCSEVIKDILTIVENELGIKMFWEYRELKLYVNQVREMKITPKIIINNDFVVNRSLQGMKNRVIVVSSAENDTRILQTVEDATNVKKFGAMTKVLTVDDKNESQARNIGQNYLNENNKTFRDISFTALDVKDGDDIKANRMIYIQIAKYGVDGWFKIKSAQHTLANNKHTINIQIDW